MTKTEAINLIQTALKDPSRENFCAAFAAGKEALGFDDLKIAQILQVSRPTVKRWVNGESAVHPVGRPPILKWMLHELRRVGLRELVQMTQEMGGYDD